MRRLLALLVVAAAPILHGCVPLVATGVGTGVLVAEDRRTAGTIAEDQGIELKAASRLSERFKDLKDQYHVDVTSYNRMVLLTGQTPSASAKEESEKIVRAVDNVRGVVNEVTVGAATSLSARANDAFVTSKVKAAFVDANKFSPVHVKVVTESNVVYLLGLVKHKEADDAVQSARTTSGVQKVVKVFEYLD